jgi:hypothetical protein
MALRTYFSPAIDQFRQLQGLRQRGRETEQQLSYRVEESWMRAQGPTSEFALNLRYLGTPSSGHGEQLINDPYLMLMRDFRRDGTRAAAARDVRDEGHDNRSEEGSDDEHDTENGSTPLLRAHQSVDHEAATPPPSRTQSIMESIEIPHALRNPFSMSSTSTGSIVNNRHQGGRRAYQRFLENFQRGDRDAHTASTGTDPPTPTTTATPGAGNSGSGSSGASVSDDVSNELGTWKDFVIGFMLGYTLGILMVFCMNSHNLSLRLKAGVLMGMVVQVATTSNSQNYYASKDNSSTTGTTGTDIVSVGTGDPGVDLRVDDGITFLPDY